MKDEVQSAVDFLTNILRSKDGVNQAQSVLFNTTLRNLLCNRYQDHWFPEKPFKGSGYRCIRLNHNMDPLMSQAGQTCGLESLENTFPPELTIWVDPNDVSYRIGENGSVGILYESKTTQQQSQQQQYQSQYSPSTSPVQQMNEQSIHENSTRNLNSLITCKNQYMNYGRDDWSYPQLAGFVAS